MKTYIQDRLTLGTARTAQVKRAGGGDLTEDLETGWVHTGTAKRMDDRRARRNVTEAV